MPLSESQTDPFNRFINAFPARDEPHDLQAAREAWGRALTRAPAATIIAGAEAYARATERRERRYIMGAARWLREGRWRDTGLLFQPSDGPKNRPVPRLVWIEYGSREWAAWDSHYRATRGKTPPQSIRGGWWFPSSAPPNAAE